MISASFKDLQTQSQCVATSVPLMLVKSTDYPTVCVANGLTAARPKELISFIPLRLSAAAEVNLLLPTRVGWRVDVEERYFICSALRNHAF